MMMIQQEGGTGDQLVMWFPTDFLLRVLFSVGNATDIKGDFTPDRRAGAITFSESSVECNF